MFRAPPADHEHVWWLWIVGGLVVWLVLATLLAVVIGRGIRLADRGTAASYPTLTTADLPSSAAAAPAAAPAARRARRRAVPLPPVGIALAGLAVALMTTGYALRLSGGTGPAAQLLSMDAPASLPRLYVTALFGAAALVAVAGAATTRRSWWLAVGLVAGGIAAVKAGSTVHVEGMRALADVVGARGAVVVSVLAAAAVVSALWFLSRTERRDRRRVLGALTGYAVAAVGLSALATVAPGSWAVTATFVEEAGEALAGVAFLMAALLGVAPRLVLPADWALRRTADAQSLEVADVLPGRSTAGGTARG
ncbi:hypothetical protein [Blastococcus saxobsidens]|uniref:Uncharacterized protein n=1 Tax=Blastococcus saxobsidens (strain DD2) TaxID=1146883 RepID=H6RN02_BLASD|nr:hypothetical protein [Blastococcus saxobsidens]CCG01355.1 conserved membrane protein of unknown function [Blastococcus saxobsidens DD2]